MKRPSEPDWDDLRNQIIGLGSESHGKNYYPALKHSKSANMRFRSVLEEIQDLIIIFDEEDTILDMNKTALRIFSYTRDQLIGQKADIILEGQYREMKDSGKVLLWADNEGDDVLFLEVEVKSIAMEEGKVFLLIGRDVSRRVQTEHKLRELNLKLEEKIQDRTRSIKEKMDLLKETQDQLILSEKMAALGGLVAGIAHEVNTPLGVGITASSAIVNEINGIEKSVKEGALTEQAFLDFLDFQKNSFDLIQKNLERAAELIRSFKLVSVDRSSDEYRELIFLDYLRDIVKSLYPQWKHHSVDLKGEESFHFKTVPGDWSHILSNLIMNSLIHGFKDMKSGGMIWIDFHVKDDALILNYRDNGKGIKEKDKMKIFEPFYTTSRNEGGTGLGLHIVFNLITHNMQGQISIPEDYEEGAAFRIRVPVSAADSIKEII